VLTIKFGLNAKVLQQPLYVNFEVFLHSGRDMACAAMKQPDGAFLLHRGRQFGKTEMIQAGEANAGK